MSSISSLQLKTAVNGGITFISQPTDLLRFNSLSYSGFYTHPSLLICNLTVYFSNSPDTDFKLYDTITLNNELRSTGNLLIPSRYFQFRVENPAPDAMENIDIVFTAHKQATSNIDVNTSIDDVLTVTGDFSLQTTQLAVKGVLDSISVNTTRVSTTENVAEAIPVRLVAGIAGEFYNPLRAIGNDLSVYVDDMNPDVAVNSGLSTKSLQETANTKLDNIKTNTDNLVRVTPTSNVAEAIPVRLVAGISGDFYNPLRAIGNDLSVYIDDMNPDVAVNSGLSTKSLQETANTKLDNIKTNTDNLVRVTPTSNVTEAIPVRLMVGTSGSSFNALRSIGSDLGVYVDDMNPDAVNNSGMSKASLQTNGNNILTTISNTLTIMDTVLDNIDTGINKAVTTAVLYNNETVTAGTVSSTINLGTGKDRYNTIQVIGDSTTSNFAFRFDYSIDGTNFYTDGVENTNYNNGTYLFSVSRLNISVPYIRIHIQAHTGDNVHMSYALSKE